MTFCYFHPTDLGCQIAAGVYALVFVIGVSAMVVELVRRFFQ